MPSAQTAAPWRPDECPITGRKFFMWIEHPDGGMVPTYGGPFDSYTIPTRDGDEGFFCERYDHDYGGWRDDEMVGLKLIDDQNDECEHGQVAELQAELAARDELIDQLRSGYVFETGPYEVELSDAQWCAALSVFENYNMGDDTHFVFLEEQGRGVISEILIEIGVARAPDADEVSE